MRDSITRSPRGPADFAAALGKDTSGLVLIGEAVILADFTAAVQPLGERVIATNLQGIKALAARFAFITGLHSARSAARNEGG